MAGALIGALRVTLGLDASYFEEGTKGATRAARKLEKDLKATGKALSSAGQKMTLGITAPVVAFGVAAVKAAMQSNEAIAQVNKTIETMGNTAGRTADQLKKLATDEMKNSLYDDDDILRQVTTTMLTFGKVAGTTFDRAQQASLDLSAKFGKDLQGSAIMVGKALNDPIKGVTALTRVGISFNKQQKDQIAAMMKVGDLAGAQGMILTELEKQVGGAAKTAADANPFTALKHAWDQFEEDVGGQLIKILPPIVDALKTMVGAFSSLSPEMQKWVVIGGLIAAAVGPILMAFGSLVSIIATLAPAMASFGATVAETVAATGAGAGVVSSLGAALGLILRFLGPIGIALGLVYEAWKHWDTIGPILSDLWSSISSTLGPPFMDMVHALADALSALWNGPLGEEIKREFGLLAQFATFLAKGFGPEIVALIKAFASVVADVMGAVGGALRLVGGLLGGDWKMAWEGAKEIVSGVVNGILDILNWLVPGAKKAIIDMVNGIRDALGAPLRRVVDDAKKNIQEITDAFKWMYDKVVGHSYVPDMVDEIGQHMRRLDDEMTKQAKGAVSKTTEAFRQMQQDIRGLFGELFPDQADFNEYQRKLDLIKKAASGPKPIISQHEADQMRMALAIQRDAAVQQGQSQTDSRINDLLSGGDQPLFDSKSVDAQLASFVENIGKTEEASKDKTAQIIVHFSDMARDIVSSMRGMIQQFKKGDILGGLLGVLDMISQITSAISGIKGNAQPVRNVNAFAGYTGFSTGGTFRVGGSGGVDSKLVQFRATPGEVVDVRRPGAMRGSNDNIIVHVVKGEMFDAHVERVAAPLAQSAAIQGAALGSSTAQKDMAKKQRNTLG